MTDKADVAGVLEQAVQADRRKVDQALKDVQDRLKREVVKPADETRKALEAVIRDCAPRLREHHDLLHRHWLRIENWLHQRRAGAILERLTENLDRFFAGAASFTKQLEALPGRVRNLGQAIRPPEEEAKFIRADLDASTGAPEYLRSLAVQIESDWKKLEAHIVTMPAGESTPPSPRVARSNPSRPEPPTTQAETDFRLFGGK